MFRILRCTPKTTLADVARSICRTPARRIALVFPLGDRTRFADAGRMDALATICREHHKDATIVGGDELLRASAVAGGLRAAVTLDDWRSVQPSWSLAWPKTRPAPPVLVVLARADGGHLAEADGDDEGDEGDEALDDPFEGDPPAYVRELLAQLQTASDATDGIWEADGEEDEPIWESIPEPIRLPRPFVVAARVGSLTYDLDTGERVRAISEDDEERLTATIRRTSGLDAEVFAKGWEASRLSAAAPDGPSGSR